VRTADPSADGRSSAAIFGRTDADGLIGGETICDRPAAIGGAYRLAARGAIPGARFTKYLTTILRLSYDNAKLTIDLRRTYNLPNILRRTQG